MGTPAENKALVQRFLDGLRTGDVAAAAACFDADRYFSHAYGANLAETWEKMKARRRAAPFTDTESTAVVLLADGDRVVYHSSFSGVQQAAIFGVPPGGARVTFDDVQIWRIDGDKIVEHWGGIAESTRLYDQLIGDDDA
jgi:predicted ester cyclase